MIMDLYMSWTTAILVDIGIAFILGYFFICLERNRNKKMTQDNERRHVLTIEENLTHTDEILKLTMKHTSNIIDEEDGEEMIIFLQNHMKTNHEILQDYYNNLSYTIKLLNSPNQNYNNHVNDMLEDVRWILFNYFKYILTCEVVTSDAIDKLYEDFKMHYQKFLLNRNKLTNINYSS